VATTVETFANQPQTTVSSGGTTAPASGSPETWTVASSASFPAASNTATPPTQFHVADTAAGLGGEIIAVTNVSGTTWTVTRGAESTTTVAHTAGFTVVQVVSAGAFGDMLQSAHNLSDVASASTARTNLGLGSAAVISAPVSIANGGTGQATASAALTALGGAALAGATFTGYLAPAVAALTFGTTISVNAALGNVFAVTLTASTGTIANPSSPVDGQVIRFRITQDGTGNRTVAWGTAYDWGSAGGAANAPPVLTAVAGKTDILGFEYVAALSKWCYLAATFPQGY
jgi:hypothetical protein